MAAEKILAARLDRHDLNRDLPAVNRQEQAEITDPGRPHDRVHQRFGRGERVNGQCVDFLG